MARYDLGLSWEEFEELTPGMFQALCKRRNIRIKYERYAHAQTAAAVYNTARTKADDPTVHPFDFVRDEESQRKKEELGKFRAFAQRAIGVLPIGTVQEKILEVRLKAVKDLEVAGCKDAEGLMDSVWPHLKQKKGI
jgi:hypothetical protein